MDGFPSFDNYNSMFRGGFAAHMAMNQLDLAKQFAEQKRRENESNIEAKTLANQFAQQRNPLLIDEQKLKLNELQRNDQLEAEGFQDTREAQKRKFALKLSEDKIKELEQVAQLNLYDADPEKQKKGLALLNMHKDFVKFREQEAERRITAKQENDAKIELEKLKGSNRIDLAKMNNQAKANLKAQGKRDLDLVTSGKVSPANAAAAYYARAMASSDEEERNTLLGIASTMEALARSTRAPADPTAGRPNIPGLPVNPAADLAIKPSVSLGQSQVPSRQAPQVGTVVRGYRFKGGDPANQANWEKVN